MPVPTDEGLLDLAGRSETAVMSLFERHREVIFGWHTVSEYRASSFRRSTVEEESSTADVGDWRGNTPELHNYGFAAQSRGLGFQVYRMVCAWTGLCQSEIHDGEDAGRWLLSTGH